MQGAGEKKPGGEKARGSNRPGAGHPLPPPAFSWSGPRRRGREARTAHDHHQQPRREGMAADRHAGAKPAKGGNGTRGPQGPGGTLTPAVRIFCAYLGGFGHPTPRIAARGPKRGADEGHTGTRPRGPAGPRQATPPPGRLRPVVQGCERRRAAHGTPPGYQPQTRRQAPPMRSQTLTGLSARGAVWSVAEFGPNGTGQAHARAYWAGEGRGLRRMGARGEHPRERAGPRRPEGASEGARAILPAGRHGKAPFT